jgi:hypothetical protein
MTALYIRFHRWRGCLSLPNVEPDLFHFVFGLGFATVYVEKASLLEAYRKLRRTIDEAVRKSEEGR